MKSVIFKLMVILFVSATSGAIAQTVTALELSNGKYLTATTRAVPPLNKVTVDILIDANKLVVIDESSMKALTGDKVSSFTMTTVTAAGNQSLVSEKNSITPEMTAALKKLVSGDKVYFEYIKIQDASLQKHSGASMPFIIQ